MKKKITKTKKSIYKKGKLPFGKFYSKNIPLYKQMRELQRKICLDIQAIMPLAANYNTIFVNPYSFRTHEIFTSMGNLYEQFCFNYISLQFVPNALSIDVQYLSTPADQILMDVIMWSETDAASEATTNERRLQLGKRYGYPFSVKMKTALYPSLLFKEVGAFQWKDTTTTNPDQYPKCYCYFQVAGAATADRLIGQVQATAIVQFGQAKY